MAMQELNRRAMVDTLEEVLGFQSEETKEALRVRNERKTSFLEKADALLQGHGDFHLEEGKPPQRLTRPIDVLVGDKTLQVQIARTVITSGDSAVVRDEHRFTKILATDPMTGIKYRLFGIEEKTTEDTRYEAGHPLRTELSTTIFGNQFQSVASDEQVLRGLQLINFIADQLVNQLLDQPTPTTTS